MKAAVAPTPGDLRHLFWSSISSYIELTLLGPIQPDCAGKPCTHAGRESAHDALFVGASGRLPGLRSGVAGRMKLERKLGTVTLNV
jgi:hypothetical protein